MTNKDLWRIFNQQRLKNLADATKQTWSRAITNNFINWLAKNPQFKKIGLYASLKNEVNTTSLISYLLSCKYEVYLPVITNLIKNEMQFSKINRSNYAYEVAKGIKQPSNKNWIRPTELDVIIVPVTGFNSNKHRIGKGYGYYDKYLKQTNAIKVGFAFSITWCFNFEIDVNDVPLDLIITESEIK